MPLSRKEKWLIAFNVLLIFVAGALRTFLTRVSGRYVYHGFLSLAYLTIIFEWMLSIRRRFLQKNMQRLLLIAAVLMIDWIFLRYIKYDIAPYHSALNRFLWYSYYIPFTLIPIQFFLAILYVGKTDRTNISRKWLLLYIPAGMIIGGILTNDLHQMAFRFKPDFFDWNLSYSHGPLYFAAVFVMTLSAVGSIAVVSRMCVRRHLLKCLLLPAADIGIGILYFFLYTTVSEEKSFLQMGLELPEFACLILIGFWECLVFTHLIPSNRKHEEFFQASSIHAGLTDEAFTVQMKAAAGITPPLEEMKASENGPFLMDDGNTLLKSRRVLGGHFYWMEDISDLKRLDRELEETRDYLTEEHAMLEETTKLEEKRKRTAQQNLLYDRITKSVQTQLDEISDILRALPDREEEFREVIKYAGVLGAYIKRRSNLLLLASGRQVIRSDELGISIQESLEYVRLLNKTCRADIATGCPLSVGAVLFLYELFEEMLETALPDMDSMLVVMKVTGHMLTFYMETGSPAELLNTARFEKAVGRFQGTLQKEYSDGTEIVTFSMAMGGETA